jgi:integrase
MASIQTIKSKITGAIAYRAQVRVKGHPPESQTFSTRKKAESWAKALESAVEDGRHFPQRKSRRTLFAELVNRYRESALKELPQVSAEKRGQHLDWWVKRFGGKTLAEITPDAIAEVRDALAAEKFTRGKERTKKKTGEVIAPKEYARSGATVNRYLATLSAMFTVAVKEWRLMDRNPVSDVSKKKQARGRIRFLSDAERDALLTACSKSDWPVLHTLVLLAISTGARRGELIGLKWADVDLKTARATVHETKNGDPRVLPLVGKALTALRELKLQGSAQSEWVFQQPSGFPGPYEGFDSHWYAALKAAGIQDFRFHDLRHTCASYLAGQGASLLEIGNVLGHRTMQMTMRYAHLTQTHKVAAIEKMAKERGL